MANKVFRQIRLYRCKAELHLELLYIEEGIPAGFPSPAMDYLSPAIDLNEELVTHPAATFVGYVTAALSCEGFEENDIVIVDTSLKPRDKDLVLCIFDGEITISNVRKESGSIYFEKGANAGEVILLGVITYTIHACRVYDLLHIEGIGQLDEVNEKSLLDYKFPAVDLNKLLVKRTASTFFSRVAGDSLQEAGVNRGDVVIVDKSLLLRHNDIAVCFFNNSFTLKFVRRDNNVVWLIPANPDFKPIKVVDEDDFRVWGIVTFIIKTRRKKNDFFG